MRQLLLGTIVRRLSHRNNEFLVRKTALWMCAVVVGLGNGVILLRKASLEKVTENVSHRNGETLMKHTALWVCAVVVVGPGIGCLVTCAPCPKDGIVCSV